MFAAAYGSRMLPMTAAVHVGVRSEAIMTAAVLLIKALGGGWTTSTLPVVQKDGPASNNGQ